MTSKGLTESKLNSGKTFKYYGYRGEALANLRHVSGILQIISKATNGNFSFGYFVVDKLKFVLQIVEYNTNNKCYFFQIKRHGQQCLQEVFEGLLMNTIR